MILGLDPLFLDGVGFGDVLIVIVKVLVIFALLLVGVMLMIWWERKFISDMQNRIGPNVAGPFGILQTLADGIKLFFKEDLIPDKSDRVVFKLAPYLSLVPAFVTFSIVPLGGNFDDKGGAIEIGDHTTWFQLADPPVGLLLFLALSGIAIYGVMLAGWSSGSKYPLLGSVRASAQMVSYEAALGLSIAAVFLQSGSLSTHDVVAGQEGLFDWNVFQTGFVPFVVFLIAGTAELNRPPFDLVEAEQELVGGFHTEYSSIRFALFFLAEFMNTITMSAIIVTLFFGGPRGPILVDSIDWLWPLLWFFLKVFVFLCLFIWLRATLPRFRYDQLMDLGWKLLIPIALGWFLFLGALDVADDNDVSSFVVVAVTLAVFALAGSLLMGAIRTARRDRELQEVDR